MNDLRLVAPALIHREEVKKYVSETLELDGKVSGDGSVSRFANYEDWLEYENIKHSKETTPSNKVPAHTYFFMKDDEIIGLVNIRYELNDTLIKIGGHIGYSIRPKYRNQGFGKLQLQHALIKCKELNIKKVLITCDKNNFASSKVIMACGGILENEIEVNGMIVQRYWIDLLK